MTEIEQREVARRKAKAADMLGHLERRTMPDTEMELREKPGRGWTLAGHGAVSEVGYDMGDYVETMAKGFCKRTLGERPDVVLVFDHAHTGSGLPLARTASAKGGPGTLRLGEDDLGLAFEADLDPEDDESAAIVRKLRRGDLDGQMSIGFFTTQQEWSSDFRERRITQINLARGDLSLVRQAASPTSMAALRSLEQASASIPIADHTTRAWERLAALGVARPHRRVRTSVVPGDPRDYQRRLRELRNP
jgi:uncharacterized protein